MQEALTNSLDAERMSWEEICRHYPDEWVVLVDADWENEGDFEFGTAIVFGHRKRRKEAHSDMGRALREFENVGVFFTGPIRGPIPRLFIP